MGIFRRQFSALIYKNWLVGRKNWFINFIRCLVLPVLFILFVAESQRFFQSIGNYGVGTQYREILPLDHNLIGDLKFLWYDQSSNASLARLLINDITSQLPRSSVIQVANRTELAQRCPENYNQVSGCFGAIVFQTLNTSSNTFQYQLRTDNGLFSTDVSKGKASLEQRHMPIQWAADSAIFRYTFGESGVPPTPLEVPYTQITQAQRLINLRLSLVRGTREIIAIAFFIGFVGVIYHLVGYVSVERETLLTQLLDVMGCSQLARLLSWHVSFTAFYALSWIFSAVIIQQLLFTVSNGAIIYFFHILFGLSIVSWSLFVAVFFKRAQLSGIAATIVAVVLAILAMVGKDSIGPAGIIILSLIFPPMSFIFGYIIFANFERFSLPVNMTSTFNQPNSTMLAIFIVLGVNTVLYFILALLSEHILFGTGRRWKRSLATVPGSKGEAQSMYSVELCDLVKTYNVGGIRRHKAFTAVDQLNLRIRHGEIFCLLGANGSGKSTTLAMIAGSLGITSGTIRINGHSREMSTFPAGMLSLCPQKNILWDTLTVVEHIAIWAKIKSATNQAEDVHSLIDQCDLTTKALAQSETLSGGMKRKLQLAIAFCGDSKIVLIDEVSSGIDPLARRKLHDIILDARGHRTQILTTHFLDEADLLADQVALLSRGILKASGVPVTLKHQLGTGSTLHLNTLPAVSTVLIADNMHSVLPGSVVRQVSKTEIECSLPTTNVAKLRQILNLVENNKALWSIETYDISGPKLDDVFLSIMDEIPAVPDTISSSTLNTDGISEKTPPNKSGSTEPKPSGIILPVSETSSLALDRLQLHSGRVTSAGEQVLSQCHKRWTIFSRNPWPALASLVVGIIAVGVSIVFLNGTPRYRASCRFSTSGQPTINLTFPYYKQFPAQPFLLGPSIQTFGAPFNITNGTIPIVNGSLPVITPLIVDSSAALLSQLQQEYSFLLQGGVYIDPTTDQSSFAWFIASGTFSGLSNINLISNVLFDRQLARSGAAQNASVGLKIRTTYRGFDSPSYGQLGASLKFLIFFGIAMCVTFAFAALYPTAEKLRDVKALHYSNGLTPFSLHLGHLLYELPNTALIAVIITILYAAILPGTIHSIGIFFVVLWLYGIAATILSFVVALFAKSQLAAFAFAAGLQAVLFLLYVVAYLLTLTYAPALKTTAWIRYEHFTISAIPLPIGSITRAIMVGLNMFSLACIGNNGTTYGNYGSIFLYGGPILYLFVHIALLFGFLVWYDSGGRIKWASLAFFSKRRGRVQAQTKETFVPIDPGVSHEVQRLQAAPKDALQVHHISKSYGTVEALEDVSFGVALDEVFALLGPNSAGKSTTYGIIRGEVKPDTGDAMIIGKSITSQRNAARSNLGVCPQFDAMDSLTVRQHLNFYARVKGIPKSEVNRNVTILIDAVSLTPFANRLARKLSGGNQRKLSLAIAMIGNPAVLLIDEASSGMDISAKRQIWKTLAKFVPGRAVVITTHSMEEADTLATRVGIIAKKMLAIGSTSSIRRRFGDHYELAMICRQDGSSDEQNERSRRTTQFILETFPGAAPESERIYHGHLKFRVPIQNSVIHLFDKLEANKTELGIEYYTINRASLESAFLKLIRQHNVREEGYHVHNE